VTRIPELEQELVAAAARLRSPRRRLVWPAARAALAVGAAAAVILVAVIAFGGDDGGRPQQPVGAQPSPPTANGDSPPGAFVPERQRIARTANSWARLFVASDLADCKYMTQPACERVTCTRVGPRLIPNCSPPSPAFRLSFARAKVEDVEIKGDRAAARFSNGEVVELERVSTNESDELYGRWLINKWGRNAGRGFFE
jgi:hypothetical protein